MSNIVVQSASAHALTRSTQDRLEAASGALALLQEAHVLAFFREQPLLWVQCLHHHYPLQGAHLASFESLWDWKRLSASRAVAWTPEMLGQHAHAWDWDALSKNPSPPWSG